MATSESRIERFLAANPYLIDEKFAQAVPESQKTRGKNRLDLLFTVRGKCIIVELKRVSLTKESIRQLCRYVRIWQKAHPMASSHYLIGKPPSDRLVFNDAIKKAPCRIKALFLGEHIATEFLYDERLRRYIPVPQARDGTAVSTLVRFII